MAGLAIGALVAGVVAGIAEWRVARSGSATAAPPQRFNIDLPEGTVLPTGVGTDIAISPDGRTLVFVTDGAGGRRLYLRRLDGLETVPIPGTEGAVTPFFSPDGQWVAFQAADFRQIKRVPLSGGEPLTLCDPCVNGFWGNGGDIVFDWEGSLWRIPDVGGTPERLAEPMPERGVPALTRPVLLPGGKAVLFEIGSGDFGGVGVLSLENDEIAVVSTDGSDPLYSSTGHILFPRGNRLFAVPFDVEGFDEDSPDPNLFVVDVRDGRSRTAFLESDFSENSATFSHSGQWLAYVSDRSGSDEVYVRPFPGPGAEHVISSGGGIEPVWGLDDTELFYRTTDGRSLLVASLQTGPFRVLRRAVLFEAPDFWSSFGRAQYDIHPDGQRLLMMNMRGTDVDRPKINVVLNWFEELKRLVPTK